MSSFARRILPVLVLILFAFVAYQITQSKPAVTKGKSAQFSKLVIETSAIKAADFTLRIESFGVVQARTQSELFALVSGQVKVVSPHFESGAFFKAGDVLLEIDPVDYQVAVQVAKGDLVNAELALAEENARYQQAQRDLGNKPSSWNRAKDNVAISDYALRLPQLRSAKANVDTAKAQLKLANINLERTKVRAPYDGRILTIYVNKGSVIGPSNRLAEIYSTDAVEVRLPIANKDLRFIHVPESLASIKQVHPPVLIENNLGAKSEIWQGRVVRTEASIDSASQQLYVVARVNNPFLEVPSQADVALNRSSSFNDSASENTKPALRPLKIGQYVAASIQGKRLEDVISIPNSTIYQGSYVYVVEDGLLQRRPIDILWRNQNLSVITSGLEHGERLVTTLLGQVTSGTAVIENKEVEKKENDKQEGEKKKSEKQEDEKQVIGKQKNEKQHQNTGVQGDDS